MQVDAPSPHPMHSSSSSSSSAAVLAAKGERLRSLLFGAEHAERSGDLAGAQVRVEREKERQRGGCVFSSFIIVVFRLRSLTFEKEKKKPSLLRSRSGSSCSPSSRPRAASP